MRSDRWDSGGDLKGIKFWEKKRLRCGLRKEKGRIIYRELASIIVYFNFYKA